MKVKEIKSLIQNDIILEIKHKYSFSSMLLYVFSSVFMISYLLIDIPNHSVINILIWVVLVFNSMNVSSKSFIQISRDRALYYNSIASSQSLIIAKILYNSVLMIIMTFLTLFCFYFLLDAFENNFLFYIPVFVLGSICISSILTFISAITYHSKNSIALIGILSFPLLFPVLILLVKLTEFNFETGSYLFFLGLLFTLLILQLIIVMLAYLLFPYLWKD